VDFLIATSTCFHAAQTISSLLGQCWALVGGLLLGLTA